MSRPYSCLQLHVHVYKEHVVFVEYYVHVHCMHNYVYFKGPRSRRRARAFFLILSAYSIIILDHHGVVIKFQRSKYTASTGSLCLQVE